MNDVFQINFFRWAQAYAEREVEADFPLVRQFKIPGVELFLRSMECLDIGKKHLLSRGLLKRYHTLAVDILNEPTDSEETEIVTWYLEKGRLAFMTGEWLRAKPVGSGNRLPRRDLRERLLDFMGGTLGERTKCDVPACVKFEAHLNGAMVCTSVFIRVRGADLGYFQEVESADGVRIAAFISALGWLGITGGSTDWETVEEGNVDQTLRALRNGCTEFLSAAPALLKLNGEANASLRPAPGIE
jgi:hypothetical protein